MGHRYFSSLSLSGLVKASYSFSTSKKLKHRHPRVLVRQHARDSIQNDAVNLMNEFMTVDALSPAQKVVQLPTGGKVAPALAFDGVEVAMITSDSNAGFPAFASPERYYMHIVNVATTSVRLSIDLTSSAFHVVPTTHRAVGLAMDASHVYVSAGLRIGIFTRKDLHYVNSIEFSSVLGMRPKSMSLCKQGQLLVSFSTEVTLVRLDDLWADKVVTGLLVQEEGEPVEFDVSEVTYHRMASYLLQVPLASLGAATITHSLVKSVRYVNFPRNGYLILCVPITI
jgi:hypothetical protein